VLRVLGRWRNAHDKRLLFVFAFLRDTCDAQARVVIMRCFGILKSDLSDVSRAGFERKARDEM
jgi:hypothetical protein